jgi:hypothetical protein
MLDTVFVFTDWERVYLLVRLVGLTKGISDHSPLLVDFGDNCSWGRRNLGLKNGD